MNRRNFFSMVFGGLVGALMPRSKLKPKLTRYVSMNEYQKFISSGATWTEWDEVADPPWRDEDLNRQLIESARRTVDEIIADDLNRKGVYRQEDGSFMVKDGTYWIDGNGP